MKNMMDAEEPSGDDEDFISGNEGDGNFKFAEDDSNGDDDDDDDDDGGGQGTAAMSMLMSFYGTEPTSEQSENKPNVSAADMIKSPNFKPVDYVKELLGSKLVDQLVKHDAQLLVNYLHCHTIYPHTNPNPIYPSIAI